MLSSGSTLYGNAVCLEVAVGQPHEGGLAKRDHGWAMTWRQGPGEGRALAREPRTLHAGPGCCTGQP